MAIDAVTAARTEFARARQPGLSLKGRALRYLAAREHSRAELERKLASHESSPGQLAAMLDELEAKDFISETRVTASVVHRRASRFGAARVRYELQGKGLGAGVIADAMVQLLGTEIGEPVAAGVTLNQGAPDMSLQRGQSPLNGRLVDFQSPARGKGAAVPGHRHQVLQVIPVEHAPLCTTAAPFCKSAPCGGLVACLR